MKTFTIEDVVSSMLKADINPAYKANATRRLNSYVKRRCVEINSTPAQVIAGVRAAVTKCKKKSGEKKKILMGMAKSGMNRPFSKIGRAMVESDPEFANYIKKLKPHWFK